MYVCICYTDLTIVECLGEFSGSLYGRTDDGVHLLSDDGGLKWQVKRLTGSEVFSNIKRVAYSQFSDWDTDNSDVQISGWNGKDEIAESMYM